MLQVRFLVGGWDVGSTFLPQLIYTFRLFPTKCDNGGFYECEIRKIALQDGKVIIYFSLDEDMARFIRGLDYLRTTR